MHPTGTTDLIFQQIGAIIAAMMTSSQELPDPKQIITPLRLIFWGSIAVAVMLRVNSNFDIINDFVGMVMILWGVVSLSRVPISSSYKRQMSLLVIIAFFVTIFTFFYAVLLPLNPKWYSLSELTTAVILFIWLFVSLIAAFIFCRCMKEYCSVMKWERVLASWRDAALLLLYGLLIPLAILVVPWFLFFTSLEYYSTEPIQWRMQIVDGGCQFTATHNDEIIYTSDIIPLEEEFTYPELLPSRDGITWNMDEWYAPMGGPLDGIVFLSIMLVALILTWTGIHVLVSLSRMIYAAKEQPTQSDNAIAEPQV